jgi:anti-sigma factor ChrR (cupin superfamily)
MFMNELNADFSRTVVVRTAGMQWQSSPGDGVWRKRLELRGAAESGRVTSIVRYDAGSRFPPHDHPQGEEILVLDGVFADEHGSYPAGTYLLNPEGFRHAPGSDQGCVLFVKLRQYPGSDRGHRVVDSNTATWQQSEPPGREVLPLYDQDGHGESMRLVRLAPGTRVPEHDHPGGEEVYVMAGSLADGQGAYEQGTWLRFPHGSRHQPFSDEGCTLYVKTGHLRDL